MPVTDCTYRPERTKIEAISNFAPTSSKVATSPGIPRTPVENERTWTSVGVTPVSLANALAMPSANDSRPADCPTSLSAMAACPGCA